ncbi:DUF2760 domain-containing protein [Urbifossiella limnaea]|uniref:DUF2760 domain-containing protein n=1 Tax=Urbifossiella limnaea TaxID=2528023 RepID=A0A517Y235_9BACT|nr:DUF2760 domain-containing protein [Urbifossiella limnaea]QDU23822.1 hypothetical protein ETAA1_58300 [Urbifossiella limnaea]
MEYAIGAALGAGLVMFLGFVVLTARAGSLGNGLRGLAVAGRAHADPAFNARLTALEGGAAPKPAAPPAPPKPSGAPLRMLAVLQAEARLVDFLLEDIAAASDEQVGQAVREVHKKAGDALRRHAVIETILPGNEGDTTTVAAGFDPSAVRVVGNVAGSPPFTGSINHPGWKVRELKVAPPPAGADEFVLQPAEVQVA